MYGFWIIQVFVSGHKFSQMAVACGSNETETVKEIHFYPVSAFERRIHPVFTFKFIAIFKVFGNVVFVYGEKINALIICFRKPGEVIDSYYIYMNVVPVFNGISCFCFIDSL